MIDQDFEVFDPRQHPWIHLHLGDRLERDGGGLAARRFARTLEKIAEAVRESDRDAFRVTHDLIHEVRASDLFEAKPGVFGFSIDMVRAGALLATLWQRLRGPNLGASNSADGAGG
jgi:hypothetical protein